LSPVLNRWLYRAWSRAVAAFADRHGLPGGDEVFEVGAGTGHWIPFWQRRGARRVDGCDLAEAAVRRLEERFGATGRFVVADIAAGRVADRTYPFVDCQNVLLHVLDDDRFVAALAHVAALVAPGGAQLLAEPILTAGGEHSTIADDGSSRARSLGAYRRPLEAAGLYLVDLRASAVVANDPIEDRARLLPLWRLSWLGVVALTRAAPPTAHLVGPALMLADEVLRRTRSSPSGKLALFRRPAATTQREPGEPASRPDAREAPGKAQRP
jgi:SAM-dependent methyltransferase